jgi:hypothetical protein
VHNRRRDGGFDWVVNKVHHEGKKGGKGGVFLPYFAFFVFEV